MIASPWEQQGYNNEPQSWMFQQQNYGGSMQDQKTGGFFDNMNAENLGSTMKGIGGVANVGLGIANYFQNKKNFEESMKLRLANLEEQKKAAGLNASLEADRIARHKGGGSSARTKSWFDKIAAV